MYGAMKTSARNRLGHLVYCHEAIHVRSDLTAGYKQAKRSGTRILTLMSRMRTTSRFELVVACAIGWGRAVRSGTALCRGRLHGCAHRTTGMRTG